MAATAAPPARSTAKGLPDVVAASTAVSDIDGRTGRLCYRGYDIHDLASAASFEEVVYLLQRGCLPTRDELAGLGADMAAAGRIGPQARAALPAIAGSAPPMPALRSLVSLSGHDCRDGDPAQRTAAGLVARQAALVAAYQAARSGGGAVAGDPVAGLAATLLPALSDGPALSEQVSGLDQCLILYAEHAMNASTFACRVCAATGADMHSSVVAGLAALSGPLHGGAGEAVMAMLAGLEREQVAAVVRERIARGERLVGFGHRLYRGEDPRATHLRRLAVRLGELAGDSRFAELSLAVEQEVMDAAGLYPTVDFFAASAYHALGIPTDLFTAVSSVARMAGWTAHVMEQHADNRLIRPDSQYVGPVGQQWVPIERR